MLALLLTVSLASADPAPLGAEDLIGRMKGAWDRLSTYRTTQLVQERVKGDLGPEQRIKVAFRKPWEIQLEWETLHPGRKVYWSAARHGGEVQVYPGGFAGRAVGILSFSLDNRLLKGDTNYSPADGGFGYLVKLVSSSVAPSSPHRPTLAEPVASTVGSDRTWTLAMTDVQHPRFVRTELLVSATTGLPRRFTAWAADGALAERYEWFDTVIDPVLVDSVDFSSGYPQ
ncbi:MAG: DUF1571 domain-containing protein [Pseudomonadota bacterium]|nr:DUF1571 domain-containing protein [Pseudomonadota bacterium]